MRLADAPERPKDRPPQRRLVELKRRAYGAIQWKGDAPKYTDVAGYGFGVRHLDGGAYAGLSLRGL
jgi:hypothetical protein